jgi:capsular polysaccharide biosynthesis protein
MTEQRNSTEDIFPMKMVEPSPGAPSENTQDENIQDEYSVSLRDLLEVLQRRVLTIIVVMVVLTGGVVAFDLRRPPTYIPTSTIMIGQQQKNPGQLGSDAQGLQILTGTMAQVVDTRPVALGVIDRLNLGISANDLLANLSAEQVPETQLITISYEGENPERAAEIVNTVGIVFSDDVSRIRPSANAITTATVWEAAGVPGPPPATPDPLRDGLLALVLGSMLGVGLALLLEQLDDRWRSREEVEQAFSIPTLGAIPEFKVPKGRKG